MKHRRINCNTKSIERRKALGKKLSKNLTSDFKTYVVLEHTLTHKNGKCVSVSIILYISKKPQFRKCRWKQILSILFALKLL